MAPTGTWKLLTEEGDQGDQQEPGDERSGADHRRIPQPDDVSQTHYRSQNIDLEAILALAARVESTGIERVVKTSAKAER